MSTTTNTLRCIHCDRDVHYSEPDGPGTAVVLVTDAGYSYCYKVGYWASDAHEVAVVTGNPVDTDESVVYGPLSPQEAQWYGDWKTVRDESSRLDYEQEQIDKTLFDDDDATETDEEWSEQIGAYEHDGIADIFAAHAKADRKAARIRKIITGLRIALLVVTFAVGFAEANQARRADAS